MKKIVITGGTGFIGSHLAEAMIEDNHTVFIIDIHEGHLKEMKDWEQFQFIQTDIFLVDCRSKPVKHLPGPMAEKLNQNIIFIFEI